MLTPCASRRSDAHCQISSFLSPQAQLELTLPCFVLASDSPVNQQVSIKQYIHIKCGPKMVYFLHLVTPVHDDTERRSIYQNASVLYLSYTSTQRISFLHSYTAFHTEPNRQVKNVGYFFYLTAASCL